MDDQEKWDNAVAAVSAEHAGLPAAVRDRVNSLLLTIKELKSEVHSFGMEVAGPAICASCGGECCAVGKHHFTVIDLLAYLADGKPLFRPKFSADACPFLGDSGCMMEPPYRPFNCVTFNCDRIHYLLESDDQERFTDVERRLRAACNAVEELAGNRFMSGLLITYERDLLHQTRPVLTFSEAESPRRTDNG